MQYPPSIVEDHISARLLTPRWHTVLCDHKATLEKDVHPI